MQKGISKKILLPLPKINKKENRSLIKVSAVSNAWKKAQKN